MANNIKKSDTELKNDVLAELRFEPSVKLSDIGVLVKDGTVTLNGYASNYSEKWNAVQAAKRVGGVKALADDIVVKLPHSLQRTDGDIADTAANQLALCITVSARAVKVTVRGGWITLEGEVEWWYQKNAAEDVVKHLTGVKGVTNNIKIRPKLVPTDIEKTIKSAFERHALLEAQKIQVETSGNKVILRGEVRSYAEREEAERAAWGAPGVLLVDNQLIVNYEQS
jgi:osmotically-inducible protein OsmY